MYTHVHLCTYIDVHVYTYEYNGIATDLTRAWTVLAQSVGDGPITTIGWNERESVCVCVCRGGGK